MTGRDDGRDRVTLAEGVEFGRDWLTGEVPHMFAAWQLARTTQQQLLIAQQIQRAAAALESDPGWGEDECRVVTVTWSETTRYRAAFVMPLTASDEEIWAEIATLPEAMRCTEPDQPGDCRILSCDLGDDVGTGVAATGSQWHERWGQIAAGIDPRLTEGPGWPPLAAAIAHADASGTDIAAVLPELAAQAPTAGVLAGRGRACGGRSGRGPRTGAAAGSAHARVAGSRSLAVNCGMHPCD